MAKPLPSAGQRFIPYGRQSIDEEDIAAVVGALRSDFLTTGPTVGKFEDAVAAVTGGAHVVAVNSGTSALHAAYAAVGLGPGDEVIVPALTFAATANAAMYVGARPVFADVDQATGTLAVGSVEQLLSPRTRAIVAVDYAGHPADYDALRRIAERAGAHLVADAAHSLGAIDGDRRVGQLADISTLSFHPVKHVTTGEGGALVTSDAANASRARDFRSHGIVRAPERLQRDEGPWHAEMQGLGFNYRLTDIQCALGMSQLAKLPTFLSRRREIAARYLEAFADLQQLIQPSVRRGVVPAWHLYVLRVATDAGRRRPFFDALSQAGLGVQVHYLPVYRHPYYRKHGYADVECPVAEDFYSRAVSIPIYPGMSDDDVSYVIDTVRDATRAILG